MPNKKKDIIPTKLTQIRTRLKYTQEELGQLLGISKKMVQEIEQEKFNLSLDKAITLSQKFNYSLDWIYGNEKNKEMQDKLKNYSEEECLSFLVDIRDFLVFSENSIKLHINNSYWQYIKKISEIKNSDKTMRRQKSEIAELNGSYNAEDKTDIVWEVSIDVDKFISLMNWGNSSTLFAFEDSREFPPPSEEQKKEAEDFIQLLLENTQKD